jgi:hypothetical protein
VVPAGAVHQSGGHTVVSVMSGGHQVARDVTTGLSSGGLTQITSAAHLTGARSPDLQRVTRQ